MTPKLKPELRVKWATLQMICLLTYFHFANSGSVRISPTNGWYVRDTNRHEDFRFHCEGARGPIVWKHNGRELSKQGKLCTIDDDIHVCNSSVYISNFRQEFAGEYTCEDTITKDSSSVDLGVAPEFVEQSKVWINKIVSTEEKLQLSCRIQPYIYPKAVVTWYKVGGQFGKLKIQEGEILNKTELGMEDDNSTYMCQASNHPNERPLWKIFFVKVYIPARCEVAPSSIIVVAGETVNVSLTLGGTPKPKYVRVDPWNLEIDGQAIRATSTCNTTGLHTVLNVVQNVYLRGVSRQTKINCSLAVEIAPQVCLLMQEISKDPRCFTRVMATKVETLSTRMQSGLHALLGCFWNISIHYVFTTGKTNCTIIEYGVTVIVASKLHCRSTPSFTMIRDAVISWTNSQTDSVLSIIQAPMDKNPRVFCRKIREIQIRLPVSCPTDEFGVHVRCKSEEGIVRLCAMCNILGSKCTKVDAALKMVTEFNGLNSFCV